MTPHLVRKTFLLTLFIILFLTFSACQQDSDLFLFADEQEEVIDDIDADESSDSDESSDTDSDEGSDETSEDPSEDPSDDSDSSKPGLDFETLQDALDANDSWQDGQILEIGGSQGGTFVYDAGDNSSSSDGGTVFIVNNKRLKRVWDNNGIVRADWYGLVSNNNNVDNKPFIDVILAAHFNGIVNEVLFDGTYNFDSVANWNNVDNLTFRGDGTNRTTFTTDNLYQLFLTTEPNNNLSVYNIKFESTMSGELSITQGNDASLVFFRMTQSTNQLFDNCEWTAPNVFTNGVKYYVESGHQVDGAIYRNCHIHDLGRMGIETVNHTSPREVDRLRNLTFENNLIENTGLITSSDTNGMGISLSGYATPAIIRGNSFNNNRNCAVEIVGNTNITVSNNQFSGSGSPIHMVFSGSVFSSNITITGNTANTDDGNVIIGGNGINSSNNQWISNQRFYYQDATNITSNNDIYIIRGYNTNYSASTSLFQIGGDSNNISFENSRIEATNDVSPFGESSTTVNVTSSDVYVLSSGAYPRNSNNQNVNKYVNGNFVEVLN